MSLLNDVGSAAGDVVSAVGDAAGSVLDALTGPGSQPRNFEENGFIVPPIPSPSGDGLPSSKIPSERKHRNKRHIIHWFVPEVGVINMYVNPQRINYKYSKLINSERTKGGFVQQYWGENLPTLSLSGHTASSGIEGINVLYEIYRSEQLNFDPIGLTMASNSMVSGVGNMINDAAGSIGGLAGDVLGATTGLLGLSPLTASILPRTPATLASLAFGLEMYYAGKVYRGYFTNFSFDESVDRLGLFEYQIEFVVTQQRGYRVNTMPWHRSAIDGPSNNNVYGASVPLSFGTGLQFGR